MKDILQFVLFDDNPFNNMLCQIMIKKSIKEAEIKTFTVPEEGLQYISNENGKDQNESTILLLDINMQSMTCWEFLEHFDKLDEKNKSRFKIYILSAYVSPDDKVRASTDKNVINYFQKQITKEINQTINHEN